jgi:hypothetical protein
MERIDYARRALLTGSAIAHALALLFADGDRKRGTT